MAIDFTNVKHPLISRYLKSAKLELMAGSSDCYILEDRHGKWVGTYRESDNTIALHKGTREDFDFMVEHDLWRKVRVYTLDFSGHSIVDIAEGIYRAVNQLIL